MLKTLTILFFSILGLIAASLAGPSVLRWYFESPVNVGFNCAPAVEWAIQKFIVVQGIGLSTGLVLGFLISRLLPRKVNSSVQ
jgi:hypothetical protein